MDTKEITRLVAEQVYLDGEDLVRRSTGRPVPVNPNEYTVVSLGKRKVRIGYHRAKFFLLHGWLPPIVDHRDGDPTNNLGLNLRAATKSTNQQNMPEVHSRRALPRGVYLRESGRLQAKYWNGSRYVTLGMFTDTQSASAAVEEALRTLHGEFYVKPKGD